MPNIRPRFDSADTISTTVPGATASIVNRPPGSDTVQMSARRSCGLPYSMVMLSTVASSGHVTRPEIEKRRAGTSQMSMPVVARPSMSVTVAPRSVVGTPGYRVGVNPSGLVTLISKAACSGDAVGSDPVPDLLPTPVAMTR
jgi:hypothetical protein